MFFKMDSTFVRKWGCKPETINCALCSFTVSLLKVNASSCHVASKSIGALEESGQSISNKRVQPFPSCFAGSTLQSSVTVKPLEQSLIRSHSSFIPFYPMIFSCSLSFIGKPHKFTTAYCRSKTSPAEQFLEFHIHCFCCDT